MNARKIKIISIQILLGLALASLVSSCNDPFSGDAQVFESQPATAPAPTQSDGGGTTASENPASPSTANNEQGIAADPSSTAPAETQQTEDASNSPETLIVVTIFTHNEDKYHPDTPDFTLSENKTEYVEFRDAIISFAQYLQQNDIPWDFQSDSNFTSAALMYEVNDPDATLLADTNGLNIFQYLQSLGAVNDTHSHESDGYNYTDVNYLISLTGTERTHVVGGFIQDDDWTVFKDPLMGSLYSDEEWQFDVLMGSGTPNHVNEIQWSGMLNPTSSDDFYTNDPTSSLASVGNWDATPEALDALISQIQSGSLPQGKLYTANIAINQSDLASGGDTYLQSVITDKINPLIELRSEGQIEIMTFPQIADLWRTTYAEDPFVCIEGDKVASTASALTCTPVTSSSQLIQSGASSDIGGDNFLPSGHSSANFVPGTRPSSATGIQAPALSGTTFPTTQPNMEQTSMSGNFSSGSTSVKTPGATLPTTKPTDGQLTQSSVPTSGATSTTKPVGQSLPATTESTTGLAAPSGTLPTTKPADGQLTQSSVPTSGTSSTTKPIGQSLPTLQPSSF